MRAERKTRTSYSFAARGILKTALTHWIIMILNIPSLLHPRLSAGLLPWKALSRSRDELPLRFGS